MICNFGCGNIAIKQFKNGKWCCSKSTSSCPVVKNKNINKHIDHDINWSVIQENYNAGLSLSDLEKKFNIAQGVLRGAINRGQLSVLTHKEAVLLAYKNGKCKLSADSKNKLSIEARKRILKRYETGWLPKAGRCKKYKHVSPLAGLVWLDGTWELKVAIWLDNNGYKWFRNTKRFSYVNLKGKLSHYTPDFFVHELGGYLEIKGYETKLDRCKWSQFTESLVVWKEKELKEKGILDIIINMESGQDGNAVDC